MAHGPIFIFRGASAALWKFAAQAVYKIRYYLVYSISYAKKITSNSYDNKPLLVNSDNKSIFTYRNWSSWDIDIIFQHLYVTTRSSDFFDILY